jgi:hypothetical protein
VTAPSNSTGIGRFTAAGAGNLFLCVARAERGRHIKLASAFFGFEPATLPLFGKITVEKTHA